jgi:hypothetical protein
MDIYRSWLSTRCAWDTWSVPRFGKGWNAQGRPFAALVVSASLHAIFLASLMWGAALRSVGAETQTVSVLLVSGEGIEGVRGQVFARHLRSQPRPRGHRPRLKPGAASSNLPRVPTLLAAAQSQPVAEVVSGGAEATSVAREPLSEPPTPADAVQTPPAERQARDADGRFTAEISTAPPAESVQHLPAAPVLPPVPSFPPVPAQVRTLVAVPPALPVALRVPAAVTRAEPTLVHVGESASDGRMASKRSPALTLRLERPNEETTTRSVQLLSGRIHGAKANMVQLRLNGVLQLLDVWEGKFGGEIALRPGQNEILVTATGGGERVEQRAEVEYRPPEASPDLQILRPVDGLLPEPVPDVISIEGAIGAAEGNIQVVFNGFSVPGVVREGRFSAVVPRIAPEMTIWAETRGPSPTRSAPATIRVPSAVRPAYLLLHLPTYASAPETKVWLTHRPDPGTLEGAAPVSLRSAGTEAGEQCLVFPITARPGAYALDLEYRILLGDSVEKGWAMILVPATAGYRVWRLGPFRLTGAGRARLGRFLLPQAIFWEEDGWSNGSSESAGTISRFRYADPVLWVEPRERAEAPIR